MTKKVAFNIVRTVTGALFVGLGDNKRSGHQFAYDDGVTGTGTILKEWEVDADEAIRLIEKYAYEVEE